VILGNIWCWFYY